MDAQTDTDHMSEAEFNEWQDHQEEIDVLHACTRLVPERRVTRETLAEFLDTDPEWVDPVVKRLVNGGTLEIVDGEIQPPVL